MSIRDSISTHNSRSSPLKIPNVKDYFLLCKKKFTEETNHLKTPLVDIHTFKILQTLRKGLFGTIKVVQNKSEKTLHVMKVLEKQKIIEQGAVKHAFNEKTLLQSNDFPFTVRMEYFSKDNSNIYFIMPFYSSGDMKNLLKRRGRFSENLSRFYAAQIVLALEYLQCIFFIHRDVKPGNVLIDNYGYIKLADFGFAKLVESRTYTLCGTPHYVAPEMIQGSGYARSVDWWSLGVILFEMVAGKLPFQAKGNTVLFTKIAYKGIEYPEHFSNKLVDILKSLLQRDVSRRLGNMKKGAEDVKNHDWFKEINWLMLLNKRIAVPLAPPKADSNYLKNFPKARKSSTIRVAKHEEFRNEFKDF